MITSFIRRSIPAPLLSVLRPVYHQFFAVLGPLLYGYPSKKIKVVGITGTKGKSSTAEYVNAILEKAGYKTALASTVRFKIGDTSNRNLKKMTMPGRFFLQSFLRDAVQAKCDWVIVEMTSEGVLQKRQKGIHLDALIFTNIAPEHIESHGSFANYVEAKFSIGAQLVSSKKHPRTIVANTDDEYGSDFLALPVEHAVPYCLQDAAPYTESADSITITYHDTLVRIQQPGIVSAYNALAAARFAESIGIAPETIRIGLECCSVIPGRLEKIDEGQDFAVVVDYAHTPESLQALYSAYAPKQKICVLGSCGGGRDKAKRKTLGAIAEQACAQVILTDEDPYDEDPEKIVRDIAEGMKTVPEIIMDRRLAIRRALSLAQQQKGDAVLISGKGTDPYIMRANDTKEPWSDAAVAREELHTLLGKTR